MYVLGRSSMWVMLYLQNMASRGTRGSLIGDVIFDYLLLVH